MFDVLTGILGLFTIKDCIKESAKPEIPASNWGDKEAYRRDVFALSNEERMKNLAAGKYKSEPHPEPHRDSQGRIVIENGLLYQSDCAKYPAAKVQKWIYEGKYNLTPEELEAEKARIRNEYNELYNSVRRREN